VLLRAILTKEGCALVRSTGRQRNPQVELHLLALLDPTVPLAMHRHVMSTFLGRSFEQTDALETASTREAPSGRSIEPLEKRLRLAAL
jgi:hypothetical protein